MVFDPGTSGLGETQIVLVDEEVTFLKYFQYTYTQSTQTFSRQLNQS